MAVTDEESAGGDSWNVAEVRAEALDVVSDALQWQLAQTRWDAIEQILTEMGAALATGDADALAKATAELELAGPLRILRISATPIVAADPRVRDQLNQLVFSLGGTSAGPGEPQDKGGR
jgi:CATRA-associated small protein